MYCVKYLDDKSLAHDDGVITCLDDAVRAAVLATMWTCRTTYIDLDDETYDDSSPRHDVFDRYFGVFSFVERDSTPWWHLGGMDLRVDRHPHHNEHGRVFTGRFIPRREP